MTKQTASIDPFSVPKKFNKDAYRHRLRLLRLLFEMNQTEFAEMTGIGYKKWNTYEGGAPISRESAFVLAEKLPRISIEWIWWGNDRAMNPEDMKRLRELDREIMTKYQEVSLLPGHHDQTAAPGTGRAKRVAKRSR